MAAIDGKAIIITGGGQGIGLALARHFLEAGARVAIGEVNPETVEAARSSLACHGDAALVLRTDVRQRSEVDALAAAAAERFGRIDALVNNAHASFAGASAEDHTEEQLHLAMETGAFGSVRMMQAVFPHMKANGGGSIVNVASMLGHVGSTPVKQASYCASKGAVVNLTRELALQFARKNVRVNALCPGWFLSELTAGMETDPGAIAFIEASGPMPRMGDEHELDGAILMLSTAAGTFMTGQSLIVDGGWTAR